MSFTFADPKQLWLEISPATQEAASQASQAIQVPGAQWQVYLNQLCLRTCLDWFQVEFGQTVNAFSAAANPARWELVTGSCFCCGSTKLVLIPTDNVGQDELQVPQEWVDIPSWAADYYLAAKINPDEAWVELWGYTSHPQLKLNGVYDTWDRVYNVDAEDLVTDMGALLSTIERCPMVEAQADTLTDSPLQSDRSNRQAESLITRLAHSDVAFPRLSIPFTDWGDLLGDVIRWEQLCTQRLAALQGEDIATAEISLSQRLQAGIQGVMRQGQDFVNTANWQSIATVFGTEAQQLAFGFRGTEPQGRQAKVIEFGPSLLHQSVRLVMLWQLEEDGRLAVRSQLYPAAGELYLPPNISFKLLSNQDEVLQSVESENENSYIQLKRFRCPLGYGFSLAIQLGDQTITERLVA
ncbi:MAG: DUF1822 family protein [Cyanobacteria bacterium J06639_14]